jgi:acetylglutamate kinase
MTTDDAAAMEPAEAVLRFLAGVGPGSEAEFYLRLFRSRARESFAALVVDPDTWRENLEGVALDLRLLSTLSLTPVVVLGFYEPANADEYARILGEKLLTMHVASRDFASNSTRESIADAAEHGAIPLLRLHEPAEQARELELARVLASLSTHKLIFLRNEGGLRTNGRHLSVVNLSDDFGELMALPDWSADHKRLLACSLTSPLSLLHELFTVKGAGTLLRRGARISRHDGLHAAEVDIDGLRTLLSSSFGKPVREGLFTRVFTNVYVEERKRGAALVTHTRLGSYLDKFAVTREAQGEGVGRDLWQAVRADHPVLFWRSRAGNPIRSWYEKQCDGRVRVREWTVYWMGLAPERIPEAIAHALSQPIDF